MRAKNEKAGKQHSKVLLYNQLRDYRKAWESAGMTRRALREARRVSHQLFPIPPADKMHFFAELLA